MDQLILKSFLLHTKLYWKKKKVKVTQSCPTLCDPMDYTVQGILQARILEWVAFPFSKGSSQPRDWTWASYIAGRFYTSWTTREALTLSLFLDKTYAYQYFKVDLFWFWFLI